jgi:hypothetical protein
LIWLTATSAMGAIPLGVFAAAFGDGAVSDDPTTSFREVASHFGRGARPTALVVDDAHLLDELSAAFVQHLANGRRVPMLVVIRSGTPLPEGIATLVKDKLPWSGRSDTQPRCSGRCRQPRDCQRRRTRRPSSYSP